MLEKLTRKNSLPSPVLLLPPLAQRSREACDTSSKGRRFWARLRCTQDRSIAHACGASARHCSEQGKTRPRWSIWWVPQIKALFKVKGGREQASTTKQDPK